MACRVHVTREVIPQIPELSQGWVKAGWWLEIHSVELSVHRDTASNRAHQENTVQPRKTWRDSSRGLGTVGSQLARIHSSQEAPVGLWGKFLNCEPHAFNFTNEEDQNQIIMPISPT